LHDVQSCASAASSASDAAGAAAGCEERSLPTDGTDTGDAIWA
jgi:hypothetical protein